MKLPKQLKLALEFLSGYSMDDVKVHYNSDKPKAIQAHAYAQGKDIFLAPGQEAHLAHEAWHIVQQKQGRVVATQTLNGAQINDDSRLEEEATEMGNKALSLLEGGFKQCKDLLTSSFPISAVAQRAQLPDDEIEEGLIRIIDPEEAESSDLRKACLAGKRKLADMPKVVLKDLKALNTWLDKDALKDTEKLNTFINDMSHHKPIPYSKYKVDEKQVFLKKYSDYQSDLPEKLLSDMKKEEGDSYLELANLKLDQDIESGNDLPFIVSRKMTGVYYTPYVMMYPRNEDFIGFRPGPGKLGLNPIGVNQYRQIICATSAMATLCGFIQANDSHNDGQAGALDFMKATHQEGKQVNAAGFETARGFAIALAKKQGRRISAIYSSKNEINTPNIDAKAQRKSEDALNDHFWKDIFPHLKPNSAVYMKKTSKHVASFIKVDDKTISFVESNIGKNPNKDVKRGVQITQESIFLNNTSQIKRFMGFSFIVSEPV